MFGIFKRKDKDQSGQSQGSGAWGQPSQRKMSKDEAARDAAEQKLVEEKNQERRDMYRLPGRERIFMDTEGRRLALRTEENNSAENNAIHPPVLVVAFWGVREIGHASAELKPDGSLHQVTAKIEEGFQQRGIAAEILKELETVAREKQLGEICCTGLEDNEWNIAFLTQAGYSPRGTELVKSL